MVDQVKLFENRQQALKKQKKREWFQLFWLALLALVIRSCAFEPYNIPSSSMVPTLLVGDYLFISKYDYGYSKHSFPFSIPLIPRGRLFNNPPQRGDVVIFKWPKDQKTDYVKRVIGLPGDTVQMIGGRLYINGTVVPREPAGEENWLTEAGWQRYKHYIETLPNGVQHDIYEVDDNMVLDNTDPIEIPPKYYFMMGDNRDNSQDSRYFGLVHEDLLEGKARLIFYSTNGNGWFFQFWRWTEFLRLQRIFTRIQ
ncbi:MAG: signal peptidase I [Alphaproteobacteria bacterium]|nr:signal peptidase I [Alphaproteobacteria bacterium]